MLKEFSTHPVVTRDDQTYFAADKYVTYLEVSATSAAVSMEVERGNIVMCT